MKLQNAYDASVDYFLGLAFKFWVWLGKALDVRIEVQQPQPWIVTEYIKGEPGVDPEVHAEVKAERDELQKKLGDVLQYSGVPTRVVLGGHLTGENRPNARKLTKREVSEIHEMARMGKSQKEIADIYDVNPATISRTLRGLYHKAAA